MKQSYALFHATRKVLSNVKNTISEVWMGSCDLNSNQSSCIRLKPDNIWNEHTFFLSHSSSQLFLGELDAIFLAAYSIVKI